MSQRTLFKTTEYGGRDYFDEYLAELWLYGSADAIITAFEEGHISEQAAECLLGGLNQVFKTNFNF